MNGPDTTIAALATPPGTGGLAVVRVSGPGALAVAAAVFSASGSGGRLESHRARRGTLIWPRDPRGKHRTPEGLAPGDAIDEVVALAFLAPASYTGDDTVEFTCHGGKTTSRLAVEACLAAGAVPAGPGEFTQRAFLNGKLSLDQAEAVADLIGAEDVLAARAALRQLLGRFDRELRSIEEPLLALLADLEGGLEFGIEEDLGRVDPRRVGETLAAARREIERVLALAPAGRKLRDGVQVVLYGETNIGKSSLFNALLGADRVIVDAEPGTTRDVVSAHRERGGVRFRFHDTAGLRTGGGRVERLGMERTLAALAEADVVLSLRQAEAQAETPDPAPPEAVVLDVVTKGDLVDANTRSRLEAEDSVLITSARTGEGLEALWRALLEAAERERLAEAVELGVVLNRRHADRLERCRRELVALHAAATTGGAGEEVVATWLGGVLRELGEISGRVYSEKLLGEIFGRFCVGK
jgi:tRNA modification GTPase